ncbi:uncharacterized protein [Excalfactoria chinensis]|uniref:uncharacterized protein n=1 Tax=Excalfactoria chinensis TaxID=46218 RepID=UPI003B3A3423
MKLSSHLRSFARTHHENMEKRTKAAGRCSAGEEKGREGTPGETVAAKVLKVGGFRPREPNPSRSRVPSDGRTSQAGSDNRGAPGALCRRSDVITLHGKEAKGASHASRRGEEIPEALLTRPPRAAGGTAPPGKGGAARAAQSSAVLTRTEWGGRRDEAAGGACLPRFLGELQASARRGLMVIVSILFQRRSSLLEDIYLDY